jgi:hypothetical protein
MVGHGHIKHEFHEQRSEIILNQKQICNYCGKQLDLFDTQNDFTIHRRIEYGSIYDGCVANLKLCCDCFDALVERCKVIPIFEEVQAAW